MVLLPAAQQQIEVVPFLPVVRHLRQHVPQGMLRGVEIAALLEEYVGEHQTE